MKTEACGGEGDGYEDRSVVPSDDAILHSDEDAESGSDDDEGHQDAGYPHQNGTGVVLGREVIDVHHGDCDRGVVRHECRRMLLWMLWMRRRAEGNSTINVLYKVQEAGH